MNLTLEVPTIRSDSAPTEGVTLRGAAKPQDIVTTLWTSVSELEAEFDRVANKKSPRAVEIAREVVRIANLLEQLPIQHTWYTPDIESDLEMSEEVATWPEGFATPPATDEEVAEIIPLAPVDPDDPMDWAKDALCAQTDPALFHPLDRDRGQDMENTASEAKKICVECLAKHACLDYALAHNEKLGVWGGLSERQRMRLRQRRLR